MIRGFAPGSWLVRRITVTGAIAGGVYLLLQAIFFPRAISVTDESTYLASSYLLRAGTYFSDVAGISVASGVAYAGHVAPLYPPGEGLLILPFTLVNWHLIFLATIALHVVGFFLFAELLAADGVDRRWAVVYLLFPILTLYSRTIMTEVPTATVTIAGLLLYLRGGRWVAMAGFLLGLLLFVRYASAITFALVLLAAIVGDLAASRRSRPSFSVAGGLRSRPVRLLMGFVPPLLAFMVFNLVVYGQVTSPGYRGATRFALENIPGHLAFYLFDLGLVLPGMVFTPLLYRGRLRLETIAACYGTVLAMSAYDYLETTHGLAENLLVGGRLLLPVAPLFLLAYAEVLSRGLRRVRLDSRSLRAAGLVALLVVAGIVSERHSALLIQARDMRTRVLASQPREQPLLVSPAASKFVNVAWGIPQFTVLDGTQPLPPKGNPVEVVYASRDPADESSEQAVTQAADHLCAVRETDVSNGWRLVIWKLRPTADDLITIGCLQRP